MISYKHHVVGIAFAMSQSERTWPFYDRLHEDCKIVLIEGVKNNTQNGTEYSFGIALLFVFKPLTYPVANGNTEIH
jgi:hypothetical protein